MEKIAGSDARSIIFSFVLTTVKANSVSALITASTRETYANYVKSMGTDNLSRTFYTCCRQMFR